MEPTHLVENGWCQDYTKYLEDGEKRGMRPVDNTRLVEGEGLVSGVKEGVHYHRVSGEVWRMIMSLYGGGPAIRNSQLPEMVPVGLQNTLNSCFLNAGLQYLLSIPEFVQYFSERVYRSITTPTKNSCRLYSTETYKMLKAVRCRKDIA